MNTPTNTATEEQQPPNNAEMSMTPMLALVVLLVLTAAIAGYIFLAHSLGITEFWAGFFFLLYWASVEHSNMEKLPACILGGFFGIFLGFLSHGLDGLIGVDQNTGILMFLGVLLVVIYFQILEKFTIIINVMTMLYLTVGAIPHIQQGASYVGIASALALAIVYFCSIIWIISKLAPGSKPAPKNH